MRDLLKDMDRDDLRERLLTADPALTRTYTGADADQMLARAQAATADQWTAAPAARRSHRRTGLVAAGVTAALLATGGVAAATGKLDGLAAQAFQTRPFTRAPAADERALRFTSPMPDGGPGTMELWSSPSADHDLNQSCLALITDAPEQRPANKPWFPQANCKSLADGQHVSGGPWNRPGSTKYWEVLHGYIPGARSVEMTDAQGRHVVVATREGYFIAFLLVADNSGRTSAGFTAEYGDGSRRVFVKPSIVPSEGEYAQTQKAEAGEPK